MVDVIRSFQYKTAGRGRGVLGLKDLRPCRRPGEKTAVPVKEDTREEKAGKTTPLSAKTMESSEQPSKCNGE